MKRFLLIFCICAFGINKAQVNSDTLNRFDSKKNKTGYWLVYFTDSLTEVKDKNKASFYSYYYFDKGYSWDGLFCSRATNSRKTCSKMEYKGANLKKGEPVLLQGEFSFYNKNGEIIMHENYIKGWPQIIEDFSYDETGKCKTHNVMDFSKHYDDQLCSFHIKIYANEKLKEEGYYAKNKKRKCKMIKEK